MTFFAPNLGCTRNSIPLDKLAQVCDNITTLAAHFQDACPLGIWHILVEGSPT